MSYLHTVKYLGGFFCCVFGYSLIANAQLNTGKTIAGKGSFVKPDTTLKLGAVLPRNFATCNYGFFCKQELKLEKQTHVPIKFRLGSIEYTNWLEGKSRLKPVN